LQLKKLNVLGSVLYIGAHPDDENNALLPYLANEKLYRTAYLSLTRGDGGQNLIGDEQGIELGLIRTQELLAARKVDGAEQYFTRAYEFGFSKRAEEALRIWDREKILSDVVWVIRQFQPDIIIKRFPPDSRAGHGHHAASAILADEAFIAAADPNRFPEQLKYGVKPWQAKRILWNSYNFGRNNAADSNELRIDIGGYNPLFGKSYGEMGADARTMHKSQGEGRPRRREQSFEYFATTNGSAFQSDLMDGIVTGWRRIKDGSAIESMINKIIGNYKADEPQLSVPGLIKLYHSIKSLPGGNWGNKKLGEIQQIIEECSGLYVEATSPQQSVVQGDTLRVNFVINKRENVAAALKRISIENFDSSFTASLQTNLNLVITKTLELGDDKKISQPYWLQYPLLGGTFDVRDQLLIGKPENDPSFEVTSVVNINGEDFTIKRPVQYRFVDAVKGDTYQPIPVLPKEELSFTKDNFISLNGAPVAIETNIKSNKKSNSIFAASTSVPAGEALNFEYSKRWKVSADFVFTPVTNEINTTEEIKVKTADGKYNNHTKTISYDHIPTITYFPEAKANLVKLDIKTVGQKIGYIIGAGDKVPQALEGMGYDVRILSEADLTDTNLKQYDAIITGVRAYNIHEYLSDKNDALMRYVENGGNLIVQYLKSNQVGAGRVKVGPYPFSVNPQRRVTEENATVNFLLPDHPALNYPNKITEKDFEGWVQERSTYEADQADEHYQKLLQMSDTGQPQSDGSLIIAKYGKGNFVYSGLVFFRQLPAGVPGAYRLIANLIGLPNN
jgi:LmbE family N-acetylglucosaminyl deacetylase